MPEYNNAMEQQIKGSSNRGAVRLFTCAESSKTHTNETNLLDLYPSASYYLLTRSRMYIFISLFSHNFPV